MKNKIISVFFAIVLITVSLFSWFCPHTVYSEGERRLLAEKPKLNFQSLMNGTFMSDFESAAADQFPYREFFRSIKSIFVNYVLAKAENNGLYYEKGHLSKIEYPLNPQMIENAENKLQYIYDTYLADKDVNVYLSIIPDKNYFLAEPKGYPSLDYDTLSLDFSGRMKDMFYIDIFPLLSIDDYYFTDSHWRQEKITKIAEHLGEAMGTDVSAKYQEITLDNPFKGVYLGQSALPVAPDTIKFLLNETLSNCTVRYYDTGKPIEGPLYNMEKAGGRDPYEMFLSGTAPFLEIINNNAKTDKELVVFRDSFGSSLAPLMVEGYNKVTVIDIRYMQSGFIGNFIEFEEQDVLFIYSTTILNNSMSFR